MSKVFLIESPRRDVDLSSAREYGDVVYVFGDGDRRTSVFKSTDYALGVIKSMIEKGFNFREDYVCVVGSLIAVTVAMMAISRWSYKEGESVKMLLFNSSLGRYEECELGPIHYER